MRLYHFTSQQHGLEAIRMSRIKIAKIAELNDPFEFLGLALDQDDRKMLRRWKNALAEDYGMVCMSANWRHPLLWAHYADKHKGLCLGFDVPDDGSFKKVEYVSSRPTLNKLGLNKLEDLQEAHMKRLLFTKFTAWKYEREYRSFCTLSQKDKESNLYFMPFLRELKLSSIIVGERSSLTRAELTDALGHCGCSVTAFKARAAFRSFRIVQNRRKRAWA